MNLIPQNDAGSDRNRSALRRRQFGLSDSPLDAGIDRASAILVGRGKGNDRPIRNGIAGAIANRIGFDQDVSVFSGLRLHGARRAGSA